MPRPADAAALARHLTDAGYTLDAVTDRIGVAATAALARNTTLAARDALAGGTDPQATCLRAFVLQDTVPAHQLAAAVGELEPLVRAGLVELDGDDARGIVEIRPYASAGAAGETVAPGAGAGPGGAVDGWVVHDRIPTLDGRISASRPDFVLGLSPASTALAQLTVRPPVGTALDLGTGCGVQTLHLAGHAGRIVATDLNPRALELAAWTTGLNGVDTDLRLGSLYAPVADERFDLIATNPPFVMSPPSAERLVYREGSLPGDDLMRQVVTQGATHLAPGGILQVLGNWAVTEGEDAAERLRGWIEPTGCSALVLERERLDPYAYAEVWLADAGLVGTPDYGARYREWIDWFDTLGITGIGLGWIALYADDAADIAVESWPHAVHQPVGEAFAAYPDARALAGRTNAELLATHLVLDPRVDAEALGRPGAADPEHLVWRQRYGFGRAVEVDTALAAVVGACDGDLPLGALLSAVAQLLDVDAAALAAEVLPQVRRLAREGYVGVTSPPEVILS